MAKSWKNEIRYFPIELGDICLDFNNNGRAYADDYEKIEIFVVGPFVGKKFDNTISKSMYFLQK
jgi:hypothetical protein